MMNTNIRLVKWSIVFIILWLLVLFLYGTIVFIDLPHIDDYVLIRDLDNYLSTGDIKGYLLQRLNDHLIISSRILFLLSYFYNDLNLAQIRWINLLLIIMFGIYIYRRLANYLTDKTLGLFSSSPKTYLNPVATQFFLLYALVLVTSLSQWEVLSVALTLHITINIFAGAAAIFFFTDFATRLTLKGFYLGIICGLIAYANLANGMFVFLSGALICIILGKRNRVLTSIILLCIFIPLLLLQLRVSSYSVQQGLPRSIFTFLHGLINILGISFISAIRNNPPYEYIFPAGIVILMFSFIAMLAPVVSKFRLHYQTDPLSIAGFGLTSFGMFTCISIVVGRIEFGPDYLAASRYYPFSALVLLGIFLVLISSTMKALVDSLVPSRGRKLLTLLTALLAVFAIFGQIISNYQEFRMAPHRAFNEAKVQSTLLCKEPNEIQHLAQMLYISEQEVPVTLKTLEVMRKRKWSLFRGIQP